MAANLVRRYPPDVGPPPAEPLVRPVPGRRRRRAAGAELEQQQGAAGQGRVRGARASWATSRSTAALFQASRRERAGAADAWCRWPSRSSGCKPGDVVMLPGGSGPDGCCASPQPAGRRRPGAGADAGPARPRCRADFAAPARSGRSAASSCPAPFAPNSNDVPAARWPSALTKVEACRTAGRCVRHGARRGRRGPVGATRWPAAPTFARTSAGRWSGRPGCGSRSTGRSGRSASRTESLARQFDRVLRVLEAWGYVDGWPLTEAGERAGPALPRGRPAGRRGAARRGVRRARPAAVAGLASTFTYETRAARGRGRRRWFPSHKVKRALGPASRSWRPS